MEQEVTVIAPINGWAAFGLRELWAYRELLFFLIWRDVKVRYKQTVLGAAWAVLQPVTTMIVFSLFLGRLAGITPPNEIPYWLFAYTGLVPWSFFASALSQSSDSLVGSANLIRKVYFPRLAIPLAAVLAGLVDFTLSFLVLLGAIFFTGHLPSIAIFWLPCFLLLGITTALGAGLWFSALNVQFRDVRYIVPFLIQLWLFATPVVYPSSLIRSELWRAAYALNPMVGVVEGFRWALLGSTPPGILLLVSFLAAAGLLLSGLAYFRRMESSFADVV